jgi:hypothetical protein
VLENKKKKAQEQKVPVLENKKKKHKSRKYLCWKLKGAEILSSPSVLLPNHPPLSV